MKSLKDIPFEKIYDGMKIKSQTPNTKGSIPGTVLCTRANIPDTITLQDDGNIGRSSRINMVVVEFDDGPICSYDHNNCEFLYFVE